MPIPLLKTKFYIPPSHPLLVVRQRLTDRLSDALQLGSRLVLVSAPAGYGKTTLLSDWVRRVQQADTPACFCWLSLDVEDNDIYRFWRYLIAALQTAHSDTACELMEQLNSSPPPPIAQLLVMLINDLANLPSPLVLILDDFHLIENKAILDSMTYLLEHLPDNMHIVIATRADPAVPIHRLRGRSQLIELRSADLRFTPQEANDFLNQRLDIELGQEEMDVLETRIEGWVTGLQMAALSMQGRQDWRSFLASFRGSHHYILEYLTEEVIGRQPAPVQAFLMQTALFDRFCAALCDAAIQLDEDESTPSLVGSRQILAYLETSNLFLVPLDNERIWFRYHHLFSDLLQARLHLLDPGLVEQLYLRASRWCEENQLHGEAIQYAIRGKHFERAAEMLEQRNLEMWARSSVVQMRMVNDIPYEIIRTRPWLMLGLLWTCVITGQYSRALSIIVDLEQVIHDRRELPDMDKISGFAAAVRAYIAELQGQKADIGELFTNAMTVLKLDRTGIGNSASFMLGYVLYINGRFAEAERILFPGADADLNHYMTNSLPISMSRVGKIRSISGHLQSAADLYRQNLDEMEKRGVWRYYLSGLMNIGIADVLREWNDLAGAESHAQAGIHRNNDWNIPHAAASGYAVLARIQLALGNAELALETVEIGEKMVGEATILPDARFEIDSAQVRALLASGDVDAAARLVARKGLTPDGELSFRQEMDYLGLARLLLAQEAWSKAHQLLGRMAAEAEAGSRTGRLVEILVLDALSLRAQPALALEALQRALLLGQPERYTRVFLDEGKPLAQLLRLGRQQGLWQTAQLGDYADSLLLSFPTSDLEPEPASIRKDYHPGVADELVEPLSEREIEVLSLLALGMSNREIADQLYISTGTVKTHAHNIYNKLGVKNRTQAIATGRQLGLVD
jgi:LuxR family transcriptional regulator, maltose regulon positive regulatory protein